MYKLLTILCIFSFAVATYAGDTFEEELAASGYVHVPLKPDFSKSLEAEASAKDVFYNTILHSAEVRGNWHVRGDGDMICLDGDSVPTFIVNNDTRGRRAKGSPDDPDYALYGHVVAILDLGGISLENYNRFEINIVLNNF